MKGLYMIAAASYDDITGKLGIGYQGSIPWKIPEDLKYFKEQTKDSVIVMGKKTFNSLGNHPLPNRINIVLSTGLKEENTEQLLFTNSLLELNSLIYRYIFNGYKVFIIGGTILYKYYLNICETILLTSINKKHICDTFFPSINSNFKLIDYSVFDTHSFLKYTRIYNKSIKNYDNIYNDLVYKILSNNKQRIDRTGIGTISSFGDQLKIDISKYPPLLTTKKVAWKTAIKELLWMLRGETDNKILQKQGVHIWDSHTSRQFLDSRGLIRYPENELGKGYGHQIRNSGGNLNEKNGIDQLAYIEDLLQNDPFSRRILWNLWIPSDLKDMALVPCHYSLQLYVSSENYQKFLSCIVTIRSNDLFLGNPFNVFSYYILIRILCLKYNMMPKELILNIGDGHIYTNHIKQIKEQLTKDIRSMPILLLNDQIKTKNWKDIDISDFNLIGYFPNIAINGKIAI